MTAQPDPVTHPALAERPMRILIGSSHPYLPQFRGGAQSSSHEMVMALLGRGHEVAVLGGLTGQGLLGMSARLRLKFGRRGYTCDSGLGYKVYRAWFAAEAAADVVREFRADVALFQSRCPVQLARAVHPTGVPVVIYFRNVETEDLGGPLTGLEGVRFLANSHFTAQAFATSDNVSSEVIYPLIEAERYQTETRRQNVTFINPHPYKGLDIALAVAKACPEIPFVFVRSWLLSDAEERKLQDSVNAVGNITLRPATSDMRTVYCDAKIVLAPSRWNEAFGRIAAEAHINGIPVVASDRGGLPEAVGPGGILVDPDGPIEAWSEAVRVLWTDDAVYARYSDAARAHAQRQEMDPESQVIALESFLAASIRRDSCLAPSAGALKHPSGRRFYASQAGTNTGFVD